MKPGGNGRQGRRHPGTRQRGREERARPAALPPLGKVARECEAQRAALAEGGGAAGEFWRARDAEHGQRPDYRLWRQLRGESRFGGKPEALADLMLRALGAADAEVRWAALALVPALPPACFRGGLEEKVRAALKSGRPDSAGAVLDWVAWLAQASLGEEGAALEGLEKLAAAEESWKPGRPLALQAVRTSVWLPVDQAVWRRWLAGALRRQVMREDGANGSAWMVTISLLYRNPSASGAPGSFGQIHALLDAANLARKAGAADHAARLAALALALAPGRLPPDLQQRCQAAAWRVAEAGLATPEPLRVRLEDMPFPGEPPGSERGQELARLFEDARDPGGDALRREAVEAGGDWEILRAGGVALHLPLAALGWVAKKAPHHLVKRQHPLLEAGFRLALRHHCLGSAGRMMAARPGGVEPVLAFARAMRASLRKMPVLRDWELWRQWADQLRTAWGRLEDNAVSAEEDVFFMAETLMDRERTTRHCLPDVLRGENTVAALAEDPRLLGVLEHQRTVELWEVAALAREREDLAGCAWVSLALAGEPASGRLHALVLGPAGRRQWVVRVRGALPEYWPAECAAAVHEALSGVAQRVLLAVDERVPESRWESLFAGSEVSRIPSWEAAFRVLREGSLAGLPVNWGEGEA